MTAAVVGYAQMSTEDQYLNLQRDALGRAGYTKSTHDRQAIP